MNEYSAQKVVVASRSAGPSDETVYAEYYEASDDEGASSGLNLRALSAAIYRNRWLIAATLLVALLAGVASILLTSPTYQAVTRLQIEQQEQRVLESQELQPVAPLQETERFLQTQVDIIKSRAVAERVANDLNLFGNERFIAAMQAKPVTEAAPGFSLEATQRLQVLQLLSEKLNVELPRNTRIVEIGFLSHDPFLAPRIANSFAKNYIQADLQRRFESSAYARDFLSSQLAEAKTRLEASERSAIDYARGARLIDARAGTIGDTQQAGPRSLTTSNLVQLNGSYSEARSRRVQAQQRWEQAQRTPLMSLPEVLSNDTINDLTARRAELQAQYSQELERRKAEHPAVMQLAAQIAEINNQIGALARNIRGSIREQYQVAANQEQALSANVNQLQTETLAEQDRSVRLNILQREAETNRTLYDGLLQRFKELSAEAGIVSNNISVIDVAEPPVKPVSPRPALNMALAGFGGITLALLLVYARETYDDVVRAPEDVERKLGLPLLGSIPKHPGEADMREVLMDPRSAVSEAYFAVRTAIELSSPEGLPRTLMLTSSKPGEGKSTTAFALARDFARVGSNVLLIDADMRKPSLHKVIGVPNKVGLSNLLARNKRLEEVVQPTEFENLDFVACGPLPPNPAELLARGSLKDQLQAMGTAYDLIVMDAPPVLGLSDAPMLAAAAESTIFVIEANGAHRGAAKASVRRLAGNQVRIIGAVLTKFDAKKAGYGYGYGYSYYGYGKDGDQASNEAKR